MSDGLESSSEAGSMDDKSPYNGDQKMLKSSSLRIQNKTFYIDLKENASGIFLKIAEVSRNKQRSHITLPITISFSFERKLTRALEVHEETIDEVDDSSKDKLYSDKIVKENRRYYIDLKINNQGRFLRVAMVNRDFRTQISIPVEGLEKLTSLYREIISDYSEYQNKVNPDLPDPHSMKLDTKTFYFDFGNNQYGSFLRISEVRKLSRTAITIPENRLEEFSTLIQNCRKEMEEANITTDSECRKSQRISRISRKTQIDDIKLEPS